jgi:transcriptional regulator with XRE-family HTH domain
MDTIGTVLGVKLAQHRRLRLLSQDALAAKAGVGKSTLVHIELGRVRPQFKTIRRLADALGVEPSEVDEFRPTLGLSPAPDG